MYNYKTQFAFGKYFCHVISNEGIYLGNYKGDTKLFSEINEYSAQNSCRLFL